VSNSPYVAPIVMVRKPDNSILVCVDYRALNECVVKDSFPLPRIDDLLDKLRSAKCMTHLDLCSTYNQVRMSDDGPQDYSIVATAFEGILFARNVGYGVWPLQCPCHFFPTYESCVGTVH
jgi:hypothetical protein